MAIEVLKMVLEATRSHLGHQDGFLEPQDGLLEPLDDL